MFKNVSMAGTGILTFVIIGLLSHFGIIATDSQIAGYIADVVTVTSWLLIIWGQLRRSDLTWGFWRITPKV